MSTRLDGVRCAMWRVLGSKAYAGGLYPAKGVAKLINVEYDLVGDGKEWAVTEREVRTVHQAHKPKLGDGRQYGIPFRAGVDTKPAGKRGDIAPITVTEEYFSKSRNKVKAIGWTDGGYFGRRNNITDDDEMEAVLRIGKEERRKMLSVLSNGDTDVTVAPAAAGTGDTGDAGDAGDESDGDGANNENVPPKVSAGGSTGNAGSPAKKRQRTSTMMYDDAEEESGGPVAFGSMPPAFVYINGTFYSVPVGGISHLQSFVLQKKWSPFKLPNALAVEDDEESDDEEEEDNDDDMDGKDDGVTSGRSRVAAALDFGSGGQPVPVPPKHTGVEFQKVGSGDTERSFLVPTSHVMITKAHRNDYRRLKRLEKLLRRLLFGSGNRFRGSAMHRRILGLFLAQAPYAGGETVEALMAGTRAGFASELIGSGDFKYGKNVSLAAAAFGSPSKATLSRIVLDTASDIKLLQMVQIKEGDFTNAHLTGDGGSRAGMKHFPKLLSAFHKTKKRVEEIYVDNCQSGETADDIARHIKHSLEPYFDAGLTVAGTTFDTGGGGNGRKVSPLLAEKEVLTGEQVYNPCFFHGWNKCLETAMLDAMGVGGLGRRTLLQLTIACWHLMKCYPLDFFKKLWNETTKHFIDGAKKGEWSDEQGMFIDALEKLDEAIEAGTIDGLVTFQVIERAVLTRWRYVNKAVHHLYDNWLGWYAVARAIRNITSVRRGGASKENGRAGKISRGILSLMKQRPSVEDVTAASDEAFRYGDDFGPDDDDADDAPLPPAFDSQLYLQAAWLVAFDTDCWSPVFLWSNKTDPIAKAEGYLSPHVAVALYQAHERIQKFKDWRNYSKTKPYYNLVQKVPKLNGADKGGREFFLKMPDVFMEAFEACFFKQFPEWRCHTHIHYPLVTAQPDLAVAMAIYINGALEAGDRDYNPAFEDKVVELPEILRIYDDVDTVNVGKFMWFVTDPVDTKEIGSNDFVVRNSSSIETMAYEKQPANDIGDAAFYLDCCLSIINRTHHQQKVESWVNEGGHCASTGRGEILRNAYMNIRIGFVHIVNKLGRDKITERRRREYEQAKAAAAAEDEAATTAAEDEDTGTDNSTTDAAATDAAGAFKRTTRTWGTTKLCPLLEQAEQFSKSVDEAKAKYGDLWKDVKRRMSNKEDLFDTEEKVRQLEDIIAVLDATPKLTAKELEVGLDITAKLCGAVVLSQIQVGKGHLPHLEAELEQRGITVGKDSKTGAEKAIGECSFTEKRHALRRHEIGWLLSNKGITIENEGDLKIVLPQSAKLRELLQVEESSAAAGDDNAVDTDVV